MASGLSSSAVLAEVPYRKQYLFTVSLCDGLPGRTHIYIYLE